MESDSSPVPDEVQSQLKKAAIEYLRTYAYLIKPPSDFRIAQQKLLIPEATAYQETCAFFSTFAGMPDTAVSSRYTYGELRLGRLNFWAKVFLRRIAFQKVQTHDGYNIYFARFYGPMIFMFASFSVVLSAMQVELTINPPSGQRNPVGWTAFTVICRWFGISAIAATFALSIGLLALFGFMAAREIMFALRKLRIKRREKRGGNVIVD